jgi:iduronate 2-sulfatase
MGYSLRSDRVRYTEWRDWETGKILARELYDHQNDPGELRNAIGDAELAAVVAEAKQMLDQAVPPEIPPSRR